MKYNKWEHRNGLLIVEKYVGEVDLDDIISNDEQILAEVFPEMNQLLCLTDVSQATFPNVSHEQFADAFQSIDNHSRKADRMKLAIYTGANSYNDFQKVGTYSRHGFTRGMSVLFFNSLYTAMIWLGLKKEERVQIAEQLSEKL